MNKAERERDSADWKDLAALAGGTSPEIENGCICLYGEFVRRDGTKTDHYTVAECPIHGKDKKAEKE